MKSRNKELDMTIVFIVIYVVGMSLGDNISRTIGVEKLMTAIVSLIITVSLFLYTYYILGLHLSISTNPNTYLH